MEAQLSNSRADLVEVLRFKILPSESQRTNTLLTNGTSPAPVIGSSIVS